MTKKEAIKTIDKAIELQHQFYKTNNFSMGNCVVLNKVDFNNELKMLFTKLFKPLKYSPLDGWMIVSIIHGYRLTAKQIYEDRITALLFLKEYVKQHGVNV